MDHDQAQGGNKATCQSNKGSISPSAITIMKAQILCCWGHEKGENKVTILHANGIKTRYVHLKNGSISVRKGQHVDCSQSLGLVGSSGNSSAPHLHFDVQDPDGNFVDPYRGKFSQSFSLWNNAFMADGLLSGSCQVCR